jgi:transposase
MRFDLSNEEWTLLEPLLPKTRKQARIDDRKMLNAIFYVLRTGVPWRDLPERYGPYTTAYNRFNRWSRLGVWKKVSEQLPLAARDNLYVIDASIRKIRHETRGNRGTRKIRPSAPAAASTNHQFARSSIS